MKMLLLIVDDETCREYEDFSPETKHQFTVEMKLLLKKVATEARCAKLNKLVQDLNKGSGYTSVDTELLMKLLPVD